MCDFYIKNLPSPQNQYLQIKKKKKSFSKSYITQIAPTFKQGK